MHVHTPGVPLLFRNGKKKGTHYSKTAKMRVFVVVSLFR